MSSSLISPGTLKERRTQNPFFWREKERKRESVCYYYYCYYYCSSFCARMSDTRTHLCEYEEQRWNVTQRGNARKSERIRIPPVCCCSSLKTFFSLISLRRVLNALLFPVLRNKARFRMKCVYVQWILVVVSLLKYLSLCLFWNIYHAIMNALVVHLLLRRRHRCITRV